MEKPGSSPARQVDYLVGEPVADELLPGELSIVLLKSNTLTSGEC